MESINLPIVLSKTLDNSDIITHSGTSEGAGNAELIDAANNIDNNILSSQTGDTILTIGIVLLCIAVITAALFCLNKKFGFVSKFKERFNITFSSTDKGAILTHRNIIFALIGVVLVASVAAFVFTTSVFAAPTSSGSLVPKDNQIVATLNDDGTVKIPSIELTNLSDKNNDIKELCLGTIPDNQNLNNAIISLSVFGTEIYSGPANSSNIKCSGITIPSGKTANISIKISGLTEQDFDQFNGSAVFQLFLFNKVQRFYNVQFKVGWDYAGQLSLAQFRDTPFCFISDTDDTTYTSGKTTLTEPMVFLEDSYIKGEDATGPNRKYTIYSPDNEPKYTFYACFDSTAAQSYPIAYADSLDEIVIKDNHLEVDHSALTHMFYVNGGGG